MNTLRMLALSAFALIGAASVVNASKPDVKTHEYALNSFNEFDLESIAGDVRITAVESGKASVTTRKIQFGSHCKIETELEDKTLSIEVKKGGLLKPECIVEFEVKVPKAIALDVTLGSGNLTVSGTKGSLEYSLGSGNLDVDGEIESADGKSGSGNVKMKGLMTTGEIKTGSGDVSLVFAQQAEMGEWDIRTGSGDINLLFVQAPNAGVVDIKSGSGNVEIQVPKDAKVQTSFMAGSGQLINELGDTRDSRFKIAMKAGSGDMRIKKGE